MDTTSEIPAVPKQATILPPAALADFCDRWRISALELFGSAVPVLPAIGGKTEPSDLAVPEVTTRRIAAPIDPANSGVMMGLGGSSRSLPASITQRPWGMLPPLATVAATLAIWKGVAIT